MATESKIVVYNVQVNAIADRKDLSELSPDGLYTFDTEDPFDTAEVHSSGVELGLELAGLLAQKPGSSVFVVSYDSEEGDDFYYLVGTEDEVIARLQALPDREPDEDEDDDDDEDDG